MECKTEADTKNKMKMFMVDQNEEYFDYDEMDYSESNSFSDYEVLMTTIEPKETEFDRNNHDERENSEDETVSMKDEKSIEDENTYDKRHGGICESCHMIGIMET
jgi:hypothetical protein